MITGIGSFPFTNIHEAIDLIFTTCKEIPFWPQLPKRAPSENMYVPFLENVPAVIFSADGGEACMDTTTTDGIEKFYDDFFSENIDAFEISDRYAPGFYLFLERLEDIRENVKIIKGQLTGPFSMGLGLKDEQGKAILYNPSYFDIVKKALHMKACWMVKKIRSLYPEKEVIIFFDEPYLVSFGSAYVSVSKDEVVTMINEVVEGVDAVRGVHCCGNTDWSVLFASKVDIVNYDAYNFMDTVFYFSNELKSYLARGGKIAPGIVPSGSEELAVATPADMEHLLAHFMKKMEEITGRRQNDDILVTTSCGLGSLKDNEARRAMELLGKFH